MIGSVRDQHITAPVHSHLHGKDELAFTCTRRTPTGNERTITTELLYAIVSSVGDVDNFGYRVDAETDGLLELPGTGTRCSPVG